MDEPQKGNWMVGAGAAVLAVAVVAASITMEGCPQQPDNPADPPPVVIGDEHKELIRLHNVERAKFTGRRGLKPYSKLMRAAQKHAEWMAKTGRMSHTGAGGSSFSGRLRAEGYKMSGGGENIAAGQRTPAAAMHSWMNSSGHRSNILNSQRVHIGVGIATSSSGKRYWCAVFGTPAANEQPEPEPEPDPLIPAEMFEPPFDDVEVPDLPTDPEAIRKLLERARKAREQLDKLKDAGAKFVLPDGTEVELDGNQGCDTHP